MACTLHDVIENHGNGRYYPYRCSRCGECFLCKHKALGYEGWVCPDGVEVPPHSDGVPVDGD